MKSFEDRDLNDHCTFCDSPNEIGVVEWGEFAYTVGYKCLACGQLVSYSSRLEKEEAEILFKLWDLDFSKPKISINGCSQ